MSPSAYQRGLAKLTRFYPFYSGAASLANSKCFKKLSGSGGVAWAPTPGGDVRAYLNDFVGRTAFFIGDLDPKITWVAQRILKPGDTAFDVGANIGIVTLLFSKLVGSKGGSVHAFEPNPIVMRFLGAAISRARATNIVANELAIGSQAATLTLKVEAGNFGSGSLVRGQMWKDYSTHNVPIITLDEYVSSRSIRTIDLIKIDIEGGELELFRGASHVLNHIQPRAIIFEDNASDGPSQSPVIELLRSLDYKILSLPKALLRMNATIFNSTDNSGHDFVAAKSGRAFDDLCKSLRVNHFLN
jgi:FkbM family methyltransferase